MVSHWHLRHLNEWMNASMTSLESYFLLFLAYFSVLVAELLGDSSAAISVSQLPLLFAFMLRSEGLTAPTFKARRGF